ncbi:PspC domain-containing protein, partial [Bacillus licheniformis]
MQTPVRPPLRRPERGRVLGGVAAGLAVHLGLSVRLVRVLFVVLPPVAFFGPLLYIFW